MSEFRTNGRRRMWLQAFGTYLNAKVMLCEWRRELEGTVNLRDGHHFPLKLRRVREPLMIMYEVSWTQNWVYSHFETNTVLPSADI